MNRTRITFDFDSERQESYNKLVQIVCSSHWGSGIDIFGFIDKNQSLFFELIKHGVIVIDECAYEIRKAFADNENARLWKDILGKRSMHPVLEEMAALFADEPFESAAYYRNSIYLLNLKAYVRADGMKPEDIAEMLASSECEKIIIFPYFPLDEKSAYYELRLNIPKQEFVNFMKRVEEQRINEMNEAIRQVNERISANEIIRNDKDH
jgi:hypothetical protein